MELTLIRHGQSANNAVGDEHRQYDPELTELGHEQAKRLARYFTTAQNAEEIVRMRGDAPERHERHPYKFTHLYVSAMRRALQTAQPIAAAVGLRAHIWPEIHESGGLYLHTPEGIQNFGGMTRAEIGAAFPDYVLPDSITDAGWYRTLGGEEDIYGCYARAVRVAHILIDRASREEHQDDKIALVSHGVFISSLLDALFNRLPGENLYFWHYNTGVTRIDFPPNGMKLVRYVNRCDHLDAHWIT